MRKYKSRLWHTTIVELKDNLGQPFWLFKDYQSECEAPDGIYYFIAKNSKIQHQGGRVVNMSEHAKTRWVWR